MSESATETLRRLLDERGVEWVEDVPYGAKAVTKFKSNGIWLRYVNYGGYQWLDYHEDIPLTPEQAIAATLGSERIAELEAENERLRKAGYEIGYHDAMKAAKRGGTLTAEQVGEAIEHNYTKVAVIDDGNDEVEWREGWVCRVGFDFQAIADDLNAVIGDGECEIVVTWKDSDYVSDVNYSCSECGGLIVVNERNPDDYFDVISHANYCCNCGRRVTGVKR